MNLLYLKATLWDYVIEPVVKGMMWGVNKLLVCRTRKGYIPVFDVEEDFPEHVLLEQNWKIIRQEALSVLHLAEPAHQVAPVAFGNIGKEKWKLFMLKWYKQTYPEADQKCPETMKLLRQCPQVKSALFSILEPGKYIPPHVGIFKGSLRYHLALQTPHPPENCYIMVDGKRFVWQEGKSFLFDDTFEHSVRNDTDQYRIVLFCDVERPLTGWQQKFNQWIFQSNFPLIAISKVNARQEQTKSIH